jgi:hypothetical protein
VDGPLVEQSGQCASDKPRSDSGEIEAVAKACIRFYKLDDADETNPARDYGVLWLQTGVDARAGWCIYSAVADIVLPTDTSFEAQVPPRLTEIKTKRDLTVHLNVDAGGMIDTPASVEQTIVAYPDAIRTVRANDGDAVRLRWKGHTRGALAFVAGAEISWDPVVGPPNLTQYRFDYDLSAAKRCTARA